MLAQRNRTPAGPAAVSVSGLSVAFGPVQALEGIGLSVAPGELVGVTGESGAGKTTLMRCIAGDLAPTAGEVLVAGRPGPGDPGSAARAGIGVVWQDLALVDRLDVAANLLLGRESRGLLWTEARAHALARRTLDDLGIAIPRTTEPAGALVGGQRQLLAIARAVAIEPDVLLLDEPTATLGVADSAQIERLIQRIHARGTTVLLVSHDAEQLLRLTQRLVVLRHGRLVAEVDPSRAHRDDVNALISGQEVETSAHHQLTRLHALTDRLASADPSSSLLMILSALGAALGARRICMHIADEGRLRLACAFGVPAAVRRAWEELPFGDAGGPIGVAAATDKPVVEPSDRVAALSAVPFSGAHGLAGVITVLRDTVAKPSRDDLDLVTLYGGYAVAAIERDRLVTELTSRNLVLETIREVLEVLAGPMPVDGALETALGALLRGMHADEIGLFVPAPGGGTSCRARAGAGEPGLAEEVAEHRDRTAASGRVEPIGGSRLGWGLAVSFLTQDGMFTLAARKQTGTVATETSALMEDAASSVRLALERERAQAAIQEAVALRRSRQLQREFLARLSHELRTPLTAIGGYAETLMQPDVTWDQESHDRFLSRIGAESTRLRRLVEDLLDHSAIESGVLNLHCDWCDLTLLLDAARGCLDPAAQARVAFETAEDGPVVWADHDRLEQVFLNLMDNAVRHNPPGTRVWARVSPGDADTVRVEIHDDGAGPPESVAASPFTPHRERRGPTAGAGLGLSIAHAIVVAHGGRIEMGPAQPGTRFTITLPVGNEAAEGRDAESTEPTVREVRTHG
ncbi:MAG TPA: ATP-binding cassette domain-containing protein [Nocardioidaceae bacterium]|nr:ATP-binding cassette domain-containing protein [Nocardioidaceae bacterium]